MQRILIFIGVACLTLSCEAPRRTVPQSVGSESSVLEELDIEMLSDAEAVVSPVNEELRQLIADILFEGLQALDADRLLFPIDTGAYTKFQRAMAYDPTNAIALQGMQDIATRYLQLSVQASHRGMFDEAEAMLENARFVAPDHAELPAVWLALQAERNSGDLFFNLDTSEMNRRSDRARQQLASIARQARERSANFLITAPNDDLARWMFSVMRDSVEGFRLRGNIELASRTTVRLRMPKE